MGKQAKNNAEQKGIKVSPLAQKRTEEIANLLNVKLKDQAPERMEILKSVYPIRHAVDNDGKNVVVALIDDTTICVYPESLGSPCGNLNEREQEKAKKIASFMTAVLTDSFAVKKSIVRKDSSDEPKEYFTRWGRQETGERLLVAYLGDNQLKFYTPGEVTSKTVRL